MKDDGDDENYTPPSEEHLKPRTPSDDRDIDRLRQQSSQKLRLAWEDVYRKFEDAHLQVQDEIYLGRRTVKGDSMRIVRDRGHLRSLGKTALGFGCFHIDKAELIGCDAMKMEDASIVPEIAMKSEGGDGEAVMEQEPRIAQQRSVWPKRRGRRCVET
ncbi:hypothetical protein CBS101457_005358 [Exobasidium rhododendri]|nr:hypothetical protein CBS101457_005358 [Exobasidium rhododendri]